MFQAVEQILNNLKGLRLHWNWRDLPVFVEFLVTVLENKFYAM